MAPVLDTNSEVHERNWLKLSMLWEVLRRTAQVTDLRRLGFSSLGNYILRLDY